MDAAKLNGFLADPKPVAEDFVPLAERLKFYARRDEIASSVTKVVELKRT